MQNEKQEIHTVFHCFPFFCLTKNSSCQLLSIYSELPYKSLLPLRCPVSLPCRGVRLYLPPGGRWLGAQPQDGGSQRVQNQFDCRRWYLPKTVIFPMPIGGSCPVNSMSGVDAYEQVPPQSKPAAHRPQAPSDAFGASSLPEGAMETLNKSPAAG